MSIIKWRESYNTGVEQFDGEHKKIVELINTMFEAIRDKSETGATEKVLAELLSYTGYHFANEEAAMKASGYQGTEEHTAAHELLKTRVQEFQATFSDDFSKGTTELYRFLRQWLVEHIQGLDKQYGPHLKQIEKTG